MTLNSSHIIAVYESAEELRRRGWKNNLGLGQSGYFFVDCLGTIYSGHLFEDIATRCDYFPLTVYSFGQHALPDNPEPEPLIFTPYSTEKGYDDSILKTLYYGFNWHYVRLPNGYDVFNGTQRWHSYKHWEELLQDLPEGDYIADRMELHSSVFDKDIAEKYIHSNWFYFDIPLFVHGNVARNGLGYKPYTFVMNKWVRAGNDYKYEKARRPFFFQRDGGEAISLYRQVLNIEHVISLFLCKEFGFKVHKPMTEHEFTDCVLKILDKKIKYEEQQRTT